MAKRRKTRTHKADTTKKANDGAPKSFVFHAGEVGGSVKALSKDVRRVLEPNTATRLRERKSNKIKDFIAMSGPLGVTHMLVLAQSASNKNATEDEKDDPTSNVNLRITRLPRGPTLGFKVLRYALVRDILAATKRPRSPGKEYSTEPILILNNFSATNNTNDARQLSLMQTMFQNLFPPIKVHSMPLSSARRVVLLSYNPATRTIDFRHYLISVRPVGVSRSVRKIIDGTSGGSRRAASAMLRGASREGSVYSAAPSDASGVTTASFAALRAKGLPNLSSAQDISDYILRHGEMGFLSSASEGESDASGGEEDPVTGENSKQVELAAPYVGRANKRLGRAAAAASATTTGEKRAVRLTELGPRMELGLVKIEDGIGDGKGEVLFHEFIHKTPKEAAAIARRSKEKEKLAKSRRAEQEANVKRKQEEKDALKAERERARAERLRAKQGGGVDGDAAADGDEEEDDEEDDDEDATGGLDDEFAYEDMFGDKAGADQNEGGDGDGQPDFDEEDEVFEEESDDEEDGDEEDGDSDSDSDLSPIPYNSSQGESASEDDAPAPRGAKKAKFNEFKKAPSFAGASRGVKGRGGASSGRGRGGARAASRGGGGAGSQGASRGRGGRAR